MRVLLTGGAGFIGSHTAVSLIEAGHDVVVVDDLSNSNSESLRRVEKITGVAVQFIKADLADKSEATAALERSDFEAVVHFAGLKAVAESVQQPLAYYRTNLDTTLNVLDVMRSRHVTQLVFSSSATVYGSPQTNPIDETHPVGVGITNPYGWTKAMNEQIIRDVQSAWPELSATLLRYFNPVGAHPSGLLGEDPAGIPNNLMPYVAQVAAGRRERLRVFGANYDTVDGTGVRDYIHVVDLAAGHVAALLNAAPGLSLYNLGSGIGYSVLEVVKAFEKAAGRPVPYELAPERPGDVATSIANPARANSELGWRTRLELEDACRDAWNWQSKNPEGFRRT
ncbi:UDP-glucose 4-epimerase GalE [Microbacterium hydrocarbonoxydans]|uniref:UDP-glucose 4-epimerase GalE n=1 Tax=Microbacterium hydrocarbonoxydans TaxID=273678 RepID=UPI0013DBF505|nr:UDP-glucose 4-epimerase GalE [Microbacterium hydrocarbonoxydans]